MAHITEHGGSCCGRRHLYLLNGATAESIRRDMGGYINTDARRSNKLIEAVTSDENLNRESIEAALVEVGFVLVGEWQNCTGSLCRCYLYANDWHAYPNGVEARQTVAAAPARPAAPRPLFQTYHNVLVGGRSEAGWPTIEQAEAAAPRARSIDRCEYMSDGTRRWITGVVA